MRIPCGTENDSPIACPRLVVGVLAEDDDADAVVRGAVKGVENEFAGWIDGDVRVFRGHQDGFDVGEVRLGKFFVEGGFPAAFDLDVIRIYG